MVKIIIIFLFVYLPEVIFAQHQNLTGIYIAETSEYDSNSKNQQQINHTLLLNPDKSFIYNKTHMTSLCKYNYIGNWYSINNELILNFLAEESLALKIIKDKNSESLFLKNEEILLHVKQNAATINPNTQIENNKKKKHKDPPCPRF